MKRADADATQIKGPQGDAKGDNKESGCIGYTDQGPAGRSKATIKRTDADAIHIKVP